jgi:hypothetical protein
VVLGGKGLGSECGIDELIGLLDDEEKLIFGVGDGWSYTFSMLVPSLFCVGFVGQASARDCVVRPFCLCDIAWCWSVMAMLILN